MADQEVPARRTALVEEVTRLALELGRAVGEARELNLPVEPGVREAARRWPGGRPCSHRSSRRSGGKAEAPAPWLCLGSDVAEDQQP